MVKPTQSTAGTHPHTPRLVSHISGCLGAALRTDEGSARHNVKAETPQDEKGPPPGVPLHQQLEERVEGEGGESDARQGHPQRQGASTAEVSHDCGHHGSEDQRPAQACGGWEAGQVVMNC